jgi:PST family polysaccharide transporter
VILLVALIGPFGLVGVGLSISFTAMIVGLVVAGLAAPVVGVTMGAIARTTAPPIISGLVGLAAVAPLEHLVLHSDSHGLWAGLGLLTLDGLIFLVLYIAGLAALAPADLREVRNLARSRRSKA